MLFEEEENDTVGAARDTAPKFGAEADDGACREAGSGLL